MLVFVDLDYDFERNLLMEADMYPIIERDILKKVYRFHDHTSIHKYGCQGVRNGIEYWVKAIRGASDDEAAREVASEFADDVRNAFIDEAFFIDIMMQFAPKTGFEVWPTRLMLQGRVGSYNNFTKNWRSVTFSPQEFHNFRGHYFIHAYANRANNGLAAWIVFDFCRFAEFAGSGHINVEKKRVGRKDEFWHAKYEEILNLEDGIAIGWDMRTWGGTYSLDGNPAFVE